MTIGWLILFLSFLLGIVLTASFFSFFKKEPFFLPVAFFLGIWTSGTTIFSFAWLLQNTNDPLGGAINIFLLLVVLLLWWQQRKLKAINWRLTGEWLMLFGVFFVFSFWLFSRTFAYRNGQILVASNEYLDFGAHVPLIRSFSKGQNFPPQMPFCSNKPIFYHFLFDFTTAIFERMGWSIAISYNLLSALSLASLLITIYYFSQKVFKVKSRLLGLLASTFFVVTPDLSFLFFPLQQGLTKSLETIRNHNFYLNNGLRTNPFFGGFFNINVFTNQRHLVFGFGLFMIFILLLAQLNWQQFKKRTIVFAGLLLGLLPFWQNFVFLAIILVYLGALIINPARREIFKILTVAFLVALPQLVFIRSHTQNQISFRPGFLIHDNLTLVNWLKFWFYNLGFGLPVMVAGWWLMPAKVKKFFLPIWALFVIPNIFSFSREPFNDHKFFCLFAIFEAIFVAWFLVWLWKKGNFGKILTMILLTLLLASGFLNLLVVKNDVWVIFPDINKNPFLIWLKNNTGPRDVFLTNLEIWDPVNLAGRPTFLGRPHYLWTYGAIPSERMIEKEIILQGEKEEKVKEILNLNKVKFLAFNKEGLKVNWQFFEKNFPKVFEDDQWRVYRLALK